MPWKLVLFIIIFSVFLAFITFNLDNRSDIVFLPGVLVLREVPVFIIIFSSFVIGLFATMPFVFSAVKKYKTGTVKDTGKQTKFFKKPVFNKPAVKKEESKNSSGGSNGTV